MRIRRWNTTTVLTCSVGRKDRVTRSECMVASEHGPGYGSPSCSGKVTESRGARRPSECWRARKSDSRQLADTRAVSPRLERRSQAREGYLIACSELEVDTFCPLDLICFPQERTSAAVSDNSDANEASALSGR